MITRACDPAVAPAAGGSGDRDAKPHRFSQWRSSAETAIIALVAIPVLVLTRRLVLRLHYLEGFMRVCGWCRKLNVGNDWIPLEEFFERKFDTLTSHGLVRRSPASVRSG